ncbi:hypothetical protein [Sutcliffiella halmapala]|uniref:hypothetical protein n=1 Tax=Sutcliffiella halmapala TaxID=79882 RepID=UPI000995A7FE|nr:hypothetical protein [Sutcliffiella halmapala]
MREQLNKPKGFGEILDVTFRLSKHRFKDFFMIFLILVGPIYLLQAIIQLAAGTSFLREVGEGNGWLEQLMASFDETEPVITSNLGADIGLILVGLISFFMYPVAQAAILYGVNQLKHNEDFTAGSLIKRSFSRFWPIIGSSILYGIIMFFIIAPAIFLVVFFGFFIVAFDLVIGIIVTIFLAIGTAILVGYLLTRWSFYFGSVVIDKQAPGLSRSWKLSKGRTWVSMGLYIIFFLIISSISFAIELSFTLFLGNSVLLGMIVSLATLFTTFIMSVGYAVMYLDLKTRHDADDLKDMIDDYHVS